MTTRFFEKEHFLGNELIFVQFRKALELIAFATLTANREKYSATYENFRSHWKAKLMLEAVEKINPDFFPLALGPPTRVGDKHVQFMNPPDDALTKEDFARLYDTCSELLHSRNPFSTKDQVTDIGYSVDEWVARFQRLLSWHSVQLLDGTRWMVQIPASGAVRVFPARPNVEVGPEAGQ